MCLAAINHKKTTSRTNSLLKKQRTQNKKRPVKEATHYLCFVFFLFSYYLKIWVEEVRAAIDAFPGAVRSLNIAENAVQ